MKLGILNIDMVGIPQRCPAKFRHIRIPDGKAMVMPERIAQVKKAVFHLHVFTFFESALSIGRAVKGTVFYQNIVVAI